MKLTLTRQEAQEIIRALDLIIQEDEDCCVNCDPIARAAKTSALDKLQAFYRLKKPSARLAELFKDAVSVNPTGEPHA